MRERLLSWARRKEVRYGLWGIIFGLSIPLVGMVVEIYHMRWPFTLQSAVMVHSHSPVFWFVDFSPVVMGYLASVLGRREDHLAEMAASLEEQVKTRTEEFVRQNRLFEALFQNSPLPIVTLDIEQRIIAANPAFEAMFGYSQSEMINAYLDKLVTT